MRRAKYRTTLLLSRVVIFAATAVIDLAAAAEPVGDKFSPHRNTVFALDYTIKSPGYITSLDLSADGNRAAISVWAVAVPILDPSHHVEDTGIYLLDAPFRPISGPDIRDKPLGGVTLSADGQLLLVSSARVLRVYDTNPIKLVGRVEAPPSCIFSYTAAFAADSKSVWVRCQRLWIKETPQPIALQLSLPNLATIQTLRSSSPRAAILQPNGSIIIGREDETVLVDLIAYPLKKPRREEPTFWVQCLRLETDKPCFDDLPLNLKSASAPELTIISHDLSTVAIGPVAAEQAPAPKKQISIYGTASKKLQRNIDVPPAMEKRRLTALALTPNGNLLIGAFRGANRTDRGGLVAWDTSTGQTLQVLPSDPVLRLSLSGAGRTLISVTENDIRQYTLKY